MTRKSKEAAAADVAEVEEGSSVEVQDGPFGVFMPSGDAGSMSKLEDSQLRHARFWQGVAVGKDGKEHQLDAFMFRRNVIEVRLPRSGNERRGKVVGKLTLPLANSNHWEGAIGDTKCGAYIRTLETGKKASQRIVLIRPEQVRNWIGEGGEQAAAKEAPARKEVSLQDALKEIGPLTGSKARAAAPAAKADDEVPF